MGLCITMVSPDGNSSLRCHWLVDTAFLYSVWRHKVRSLQKKGLMKQSRHILLLLGFCYSDTNLQLVTKLLRVRNKATICIPFEEPRAAPDLCRLLLPVDGGAYAVIELHIITASIGTYDHVFWVWLNWKNNKPTENIRSLCSEHSGWKRSQITLNSIGTHRSCTSPPAEASR